MIWSSAYFQQQWQYAFDPFHSVSLIAASAFIAWRAHSSLWLVFSAEHVLACDGRSAVASRRCARIDFPRLNGGS
jgi:hypothetical protein